VQQAQKERDRKESAALIKKMVQFNSLVVTPILEKIQVRARACLCRFVAPGFVAERWHVGAADRTFRAAAAKTSRPPSRPLAARQNRSETHGPATGPSSPAEL
jgi:hypothetical protein